MQATTVFGSMLTDYEVEPAILEDKHATAPEPLLMATKGLEGIKEGFDMLAMECQRRRSSL